MQTLESEGGAALKLAEILDLKAAAGLHSSILAHRGHDLTLNASEVRRLGGLCLQVLLAAVFAWRVDGKFLTFTQPSRPFIEALDLFGLTFDDEAQKE